MMHFASVPEFAKSMADEGPLPSADPEYSVKDVYRHTENEGTK